MADLKEEDHQTDFKLVKVIDNTRFSFGSSPLFISRYTPNQFKIYIFK